jgi:hypothetical protein
MVQNEIKFELKAFQLSQRMLSTCILDGDNQTLSKALDAVTVIDNVINTYERMENQTTVEYSDTDNFSSWNIATAEGIFIRDGLLMQEENILQVLSQHCVHEMRRRDVEHKSSALLSGNRKIQSKGAENAVDIEACVQALQKHENHLMALQILYRSWSFNLCKAQVFKFSNSTCRPYSSFILHL